LNLKGVNNMSRFSEKTPAIIVLIIAIVVLVLVGIKEVGVPKKESNSNVSQKDTKEKAEETKEFSEIDLTGFSTKTISGETVTSDYFKEYDITMINLWATYCNPCIKEMPEIAKLYKNKPEKSNIISICIGTEKDAEDVKLASQIMKDANAEFLTLIPDEKLSKTLISHVSVVPTTVFVDRYGKIVGEPILGSQSAEEYEKAIIDRLK